MNITKKSEKKYRAFSLIELSIVILIIGILISGISQSSRLYQQFKLSTARTLTQSSPASSIKDMVLWIESTSIASFDEEANVEDGVAITNWHDINPQSTIKSSFNQETANAKPIYKENIINSLPAISFEGNDFMESENFPNVRDVSVFMVVKTPETLASKTILSKRSASNANEANFATRLRANNYDGEIWDFCYNRIMDYLCTPSQGTKPSSITIANTPYIVSMIYKEGSSTNGLNIYEDGANRNYDGIITDTSAANAQLVDDNLLLGRDGYITTEFFIGHIAEIIIYNRTLKNEERQSIEDYLSKKWGIKLNRS